MQIRQGEKNSKCFIWLNGKSLEISKSQFNYLENKKDKNVKNHR